MKKLLTLLLVSFFLFSCSGKPKEFENKNLLSKKSTKDILNNLEFKDDKVIQDLTDIKNNPKFEEKKEIEETAEVFEKNESNLKKLKSIFCGKEDEGKKYLSYILKEDERCSKYYLKENFISYFYSDHEIKEGLTLDQIKIISKDVLKTKNEIFYDGKLINQNIDIQSFECIYEHSSSEDVYKDKNYVYTEFFGEFEISKKLDAKSFKHIYSDIFKDKNHVYRRKSEKFKILEEIDPENFSHIDEDFYKNKNHIYYKDYDLGLMRLKDVNIKTFQIIKNYYSRDNNHIYFENKIIKEASSENFEIINYHLSKDKSYVYVEDEIVKNADPKSFKILKEEYSKDENHVYFESKLLENIDSKTFQVLEKGFAEDKNYLIYKNQKFKKQSKKSVDKSILKENRAFKNNFLDGNIFSYQRERNEKIDLCFYLNGYQPSCIQDIFSILELYDFDEKDEFYGIEWIDETFFKFKRIHKGKSDFFKVDQNMNILKLKDSYNKPIEGYHFPRRLLGDTPCPLVEQQHMGCIVEEIYPIGWSKNGQYFAYISTQENEGAGFTSVSILIFDIKRNEFISKGLEDKVNISFIWNENKSKIIKFLKKYDIIQYENIIINTPTSFIYEGDTYNVHLSSGSARYYDKESIYKEKIFLESNKLGVREIESSELNTSYESSFISGFIRNPRDKSLQIVVKKFTNIGWEGPPNVTDIHLIGINLKKTNFSKNHKDISRNLNDKGMQLYMKFKKIIKQKNNYTEDDFDESEELMILLKNAESYFDLANNISIVMGDGVYYQALYNEMSVQVLRFRFRDALKTLKQLLLDKEHSAKYKEKIINDTDFYILWKQNDIMKNQGIKEDTYYINASRQDILNLLDMKSPLMLEFISEWELNYLKNKVYHKE